MGSRDPLLCYHVIFQHRRITRMSTVLLVNPLDDEGKGITAKGMRIFSAYRPASINGYPD